MATFAACAAQVSPSTGISTRGPALFLGSSSAVRRTLTGPSTATRLSVRIGRRQPAVPATRTDSSTTRPIPPSLPLPGGVPAQALPRAQPAGAVLLSAGPVPVEQECLQA